MIHGSKLAGHHLRCAGEDGCSHQDGHPINMKEGELIDHDIRFRNFMDLNHLVEIAEEIEVGQHDSLGKAGRPAREREDGDPLPRVYSDGTVQSVRSRKKR